MKKIVLILLTFYALTSLAAPIGGIHTVTEPAYRMPAKADSFHTAKPKELINWGDSLKTGAAGFMGILFQDGSLVKMAANTEILLSVPEFKDSPKKIKMKFGDLWAKITKSDQTMEVHTPSSVASIKGTKFWLLVSPSGDSRLLCQEGVIELLNTISGHSWTMGPGEMCTSNMDGSMDISHINPEESEPSPQAPDSTPPSGGQTGGGPSWGSTTPPPAAGGGGGIGMSGAVGATTINGVNYQYFSLRPDISIWKFGIGLDLAFYFDSDGNLREEDWDESQDYIDKIYYLRYGKPGDPLFIRVGSLSPITLGYGLIMRRYTNAIEWPQVRRVGLQTEIHKGPFTFHGLVNNFREIETPGLVGARLEFEKRFILPIVFGGTIVHDGNQYLGAKDDDGDGIPNQWDMFSDDDFDHIAYLWSFLDTTQINNLIDSGDLPNIYDRPKSIQDMEAPVTEWGLDIGIPLIRTKAVKLWTYAQMAQIVDYGRGISFPGVKFDIGPFHAGAEYRIFESKFLPEFFYMTYETDRVVWSEEDSTYLTKSETLEDISSAQGYYAEAGVNLFNMLDVFASYQQMSYEGSEPGKTIFGQVSLNTKFIPKLELAEAYYLQPNVEDLFRTKSNGTIIGYKVGFGLGGGVMIVYDNKTIYYNGQPNHIMTIETALTF